MEGITELNDGTRKVVSIMFITQQALTDFLLNKQKILPTKPEQNRCTAGPPTMVLSICVTPLIINNPQILSWPERELSVRSGIV